MNSDASSLCALAGANMETAKELQLLFKVRGRTGFYKGSNMLQCSGKWREDAANSAFILLLVSGCSFFHCISPDLFSAALLLHFFPLLFYNDAK